MTLRDIQADPKTEALFNILLQHLDKTRAGRYKGIYEKALSGVELSAADEKAMKFARHELAIKLPKGEYIRSHIHSPTGTTDVQIGMKRDPAFANIVEFNGVQHTKDVIEEEALVLAMNLDHKELDRYYSSFRVLETDRKTLRYRRWQKETEKKVLTASKTNWLDYQKVFKLGTGAAREDTRRVVLAQIRKDWGKFRKVVDFINPLPNASNPTSKRIIDHAVRLHKMTIKSIFSPTSWKVSSVNKQLDTVTQFMSLTLSHDPEVRRALQQSGFRNESLAARRPKPQTFKQAQDIRHGLQSRVPDAVTRNWEAYKRGVPGGWNAKTPDQRRQLRDAWHSPELDSGSVGFDQTSRSQPEKNSIWSFLGGVLTAIVTALTNKNKESLSLGNTV